MELSEIYTKVVKITKQINKTGKSGNRSSKRTDVLNDEFAKWLAPKLSDGWTFEPEHKITCSRGQKFSIDLIGYKDGEMKALFLFKAVQSSYNKNRHNYSNTLEGETSRIFDVADREGLDVFFIDWIPNEVPLFNRKGKKIKVERPNPPNLTLAENRWNSSLAIKNCSVSFIKLRFDYDFNTDTLTNASNDNIAEKSILKRLQ